MKHPLHCLRVFDMQFTRTPALGRTGLRLMLLFMLSACAGSSVETQRRRSAVALEMQYRLVMRLENQVTRQSADTALEAENRHGLSADAAGALLPWWVPQSSFTAALEMSPFTAQERRNLKLKLIRKHGMALVLFKPSPADRAFSALGKADPHGFTLQDLHQEFGPDLPPFSSLLRLCLMESRH